MMKNKLKINNKNNNKNKEENYLDRIPVRSDEYEWIESNGLVTVKQENKGTYNKIAQKFFKTPAVSNIDLDRFGSFVWLQIDGKRTIFEIGNLVKEEFGKEAEPLFERLSTYFYTLNSVKFISFKQKED